MQLTFVLRYSWTKIVSSNANVFALKCCWFTKLFCKLNILRRKVLNANFQVKRKGTIEVKDVGVKVNNSKYRKVSIIYGTNWRLTGAWAAAILISWIRSRGKMEQVHNTGIGTYFDRRPYGWLSWWTLFIEQVCLFSLTGFFRSIVYYLPCCRWLPVPEVLPTPVFWTACVLLRITRKASKCSRYLNCST